MAAVGMAQYQSGVITASSYPGYSFDPLQHSSGISPYFPAPGYGIDPLVPEGCTVEKATYLSRHSNIYANDNDYEIYIEPLVAKLNATNATFSGPLSFLSNWTNPIAEDDIEELTPSGLADAQAMGELFAFRYPLFSNASANTTKIWAATSERSNDSAHAFARGFSSSLRMAPALVEVYEGKNASADTLTPHSSCPRYSGSAGVSQSNVFLYTYAPPIIARLSRYTNVNLTAYDISAMQRLCGYESVIDGNATSNFCTLFTSNEWLQFEYANDIQYHYGLGYGSGTLSPTLGFPWLQASAALLSDANDASQDFYMSFTHREEPFFVATALGLFNDSIPLDTSRSELNGSTAFPLTEVNYRRQFVSSRIVPFLGHVGLERLACPTLNNGTETLVRVIVNGAVQPIPGCSSGVGASCPLDRFTQYVESRAALFGDFIGTCGLQSQANATDSLSIYITK